MSVLDPAHGEAGVYCVPVLLMHVPKLVREDVDQRLSTVAQHQLPTLVLSVRVPIPPAMVLPLETRTYLVPPEVFKIAQINVHQGNTIPLSNVVRSGAVSHGH
jgi:hypothetical protein